MFSYDDIKSYENGRNPENPFDPSTHDGDGDGEDIPMRPTRST